MMNVKKVMIIILLYTIFAQQFGGGVLIDLLGTLGNIKLNNCTTYINTQYTIDQVNFYMCIRLTVLTFDYADI